MIKIQHARYAITMQLMPICAEIPSVQRCSVTIVHRFLRKKINALTADINLFKLLNTLIVNKSTQSKRIVDSVNKNLR